MCNSMTMARSTNGSYPLKDSRGRFIAFKCELCDGHAGPHRLSRIKPTYEGSTYNAIISWDGDDRLFLLDNGWDGKMDPT